MSPLINLNRGSGKPTSGKHGTVRHRKAPGVQHDVGSIPIHAPHTGLRSIIRYHARLSAYHRKANQKRRISDQ